jgi:hypothetical protein
LFATGETLSASYIDEDTELTVTVTGRLIGSLSEIKINSTNRGLFYNGYDTDTGYPGDPVSIVGGLNPTANTPIGAVAFVGDVTKGGITDILVEKSGFGFRDPAVNVGSSIIDFKGGFTGAVFGTEAKASISLLDTTVSRLINISNMSVSTLHGLRPNIANIENVTISNAMSFGSFTVFPISFVTIDGSGGGYRQKPTVETYSFYNEEYFNIKSIVIKMFLFLFLTNLLGVLICFPYIWSFFNVFNHQNELDCLLSFSLELRVQEYFNFFFTFLYLINLASFLVLGVLLILSFLDLQQKLYWKKLFTFFNVVFATLLSPPDVFSQLVFLVVLVTLFELVMFFSILQSKLNKYL